MLSAARPGLLPRSQTTSITQKLLIQVINSGINTEIWAVLPRHAPWPSHERLWVRFSAWAFCNPISPHGRGLLFEIYKCFSDHPLKMTAIYKIALVIRTGNGVYFSWSLLLSVVWLLIVFIVWSKYDCFYGSYWETQIREGLVRPGGPVTTVFYGELAKNAAKICCY